MEVEFSELIGKIITKVVCTDNEVYITTSDCEHYLMSHILNRYGKKHGRWP